MKKLTCPYTWDCGQTFEPQELSKYDYDFLQSATEKQMTFMFIHCPECLRRFQFDTVAWKSTGTISDPTKKTEKPEPKPVKELLAILKKSDAVLPQQYLDYLASKAFKPDIQIFKKQDTFKLYTLDELCETINIDGNKILRIESLNAYVESLKEVFEEDTTEPFSFAELETCPIIGYENTQVLFLDSRDTDSIWVFHPDDGDVEPTNMTLEKIIKQN